MPALHLNITIEQDQAGGVRLNGNDNNGDYAPTPEDAATAFGISLTDPALRFDLARLVYAYHVLSGNASGTTYSISFDPASSSPITIATVS